MAFEALSFSCFRWLEDCQPPTLRDYFKLVVDLALARNCDEAMGLDCIETLLDTFKLYRLARVESLSYLCSMSSKMLLVRSLIRSSISYY